MGFLLVQDILSDVSFALLEPRVVTTLGTAVAAAGIGVCSPPSMAGIYPGAMLSVLLAAADLAGAESEVVTVISTTTTTFTAQFQFPHIATAVLKAPTFPSGQTDHPLFTQAEMLGYFADVQNDFLTRVRPIYAVGSAAMRPNIPVYAIPSDAIRVERIALAGRHLSNVAQHDIDWLDPAFAQSGVPQNPDYWYQDGIQVQSFGVAPTPQRQDTFELFYSQRAGTTVSLLDNLFVPDVMGFVLKFGILARAWSKDGEQRDPARAQACQQMYDLMVMVAKKFLYGISGRMNREDETVEPLIGAAK